MDTFIPKGNISGPILPEFVLSMSIPAGAKLLYAVLCKHAFVKGFCWPSYANLAKRLGCSVNSIKNYFRSLVDAGLVFIKKETYRSSIYYLLKPSAELLAASGTENCYQQISGDLQDDLSNFDSEPSNLDENPPNFGYLKNQKKEKNETPPSTSKPEENGSRPIPDTRRQGGGDFSFDDFERIYEAYPRKESKGTARAAWRSLLTAGLLPPIAVILEAIERFKAGADWQRENGRFIPYLANFLKGERWNDPLSDAETEAKKKSDEAAQIRQLQEQREEQKRKAHAEKTAKLEPLFDEFAAKFKEKFHKPMVFGMWLAYHGNGFAPLASDVPANNALGILEFMKKFRASKQYSPKVQTPLSDNQTAEVAVESASTLSEKAKKPQIPLPDWHTGIQSTQELTGQILNRMRVDSGRKLPSESVPLVGKVA